MTTENSVAPPSALSPQSVARAELQQLLDENPEGREQRARNFEDSHVLSRPQLIPIALFGMLKEITDIACKNTEAVPISVAVHVMTRFAATIGRTAYIQLGDTRRYLNLFSLVVGPTSKGRKGTSADMPKQLFRYAEGLKVYVSPLQQLTALSTGEGLIHRVRDEMVDEESGKVIDRGVYDKRLICDVSEFSGVLTVAGRKDNTLSATLRDAFDGGVLTIPTKTSFNRATGAHISIVGSIPEAELVQSLKSVDIVNGLANRFMMFFSARSKLVSDPQPTPPELMDSLAKRLVEALDFAVMQGEITLDEEARDYWDAIYVDLNEQTREPAVAKLLGREELYTRVVAALIALMHKENVVRCQHLDAAMAWRQYWEDTLNFVFSTSEKNEGMKRMRDFMDRVVNTIDTLGGKKVSHSALTKKLTNNYAKNCPITREHVKAALELLQRESPARIITETNDDTNGRPSNVYTLSYFRR